MHCYEKKQMEHQQKERKTEDYSVDFLIPSFCFIFSKVEATYQSICHYPQ